MQNAIKNKQFDGEYDGIPVVKYEAALHGEVQKPGLGPLHTEFDGKGNAYTTFFVSSEVVKWDIKSLKVLDRVPTYYSVGHLCIPGGDSKKPFGKYLVAYNKIKEGEMSGYIKPKTGQEMAQRWVAYVTYMTKLATDDYASLQLEKSKTAPTQAEDKF